MSFDVTQVGDAAAFAAANGMQFEAAGGHPRFGGAVFEYLQDATVTDVFRDETIEVGTISGRVGGSQTKQDGGWTVSTTTPGSASFTAHCSPSS